MRNTQRKPHATTEDRRWSPSRLLVFLVGIAIVTWFIGHVGTDQVRTQLLRVGPRALWLLVPYAIGTAIGAAPWAMLLPREMRPSALAVLEGRFAASSANSILPFFGVAGEPSRLLWLPSNGRANGVAAIVVDRVLYNSANGLLLFTGALAAWWFTSLPGSLVASALVVAVLTLSVTAVALWVVPKYGIGRKIQRLLRWLVGESYTNADFGSQVDAVLMSIVRGPRRPLVIGAGVHLFGRAAIAFEVWVGLQALGARADAAETVVLAVVPIALSFFFSSIPGQLGVQEGAQTLMASALGLDPAVVLSLVLLQRFRQLAFAALLPLLLAMARPPTGNDARAAAARSAVGAQNPRE
jgi:uncharacterized protein (TIRG00374 family)